MYIWSKSVCRLWMVPDVSSYGFFSLMISRSSSSCWKFIAFLSLVDFYSKICIILDSLVVDDNRQKNEVVGLFDTRDWRLKKLSRLLYHFQPFKWHFFVCDVSGVKLVIKYHMKLR